LEETIAACLHLYSTERLYLPGPRACHLDQTKAVNHTNLIFLKEPLVPVKALSTIVDVVLKQADWYYLFGFVLQLDQFKQGGLS